MIWLCNVKFPIELSTVQSTRHAAGYNRNVWTIEQVVTCFTDSLFVAQPQDYEGL